MSAPKKYCVCITTQWRMIAMIVNCCIHGSKIATIYRRSGNFHVKNCVYNFILFDLLKMHGRSYCEIILTAKFSQSTVSIMLRLLPCSGVDLTINYSACTVKHLAKQVLYVVPVYQSCMPHYSLDIHNTLAAANSNLQRKKNVLQKFGYMSTPLN